MSKNSESIKKQRLNDKKVTTYDLVKRFIDIVVSVCFIFVFAPVYAITALAIWLQDWHSPMYSQLRVGKDRKQFRIYKFRSMVVNADEILFKDPKLYKQMRSGVNKVIDDPRVTKVGKFIRKFSIDEFPQFLNVLKGEMSVVGPRSLRPDEYDNYAKKSPENKRKLDILTSVKPGITGYWQVSGRSNVDFEKRMSMDCYYANKKSILFDILIMLKTPIAMLKAEGAY